MGNEFSVIPNYALMSDHSHESMISRGRKRRAKLPMVLDQVSEEDSDELEPVELDTFKHLQNHLWSRVFKIQSNDQFRPERCSL